MSTWVRVTRDMCHYHRGMVPGSCAHYKFVAELPYRSSKEHAVQFFSCVDCGNLVFDRAAHDTNHPEETAAERTDRVVQQYVADVEAGKGRIDSLVAAWKAMGATDAEVRASLSYIGPETHQ